MQDALAQYEFDHWTTDDGLPQNTVNAILQTRDGYLWLATFDGLARFDGLQFAVFNKVNTKGIGGNRFDTLFEDSQGALWAVTDDSWLVKYQAGVFTTYTPNEGLPQWTIRQIEEDEAGNFQIVSREGIAKWKDGRFITYPLKDLLPASVGAKWIGGNRLAWLGEDKVYLYRHGRLNAYSIQSGLSGLNVRTVVEDQHGIFWITFWGDGLARVEDGQVTIYPVKYPSGGFAVAAQEDRKGNIWLAWDGGLGQVKNGRLTRYTHSQDFPASGNTNFYEDREGNFWIGSTNGLYRAREATISVFTRQDGLSSDNVYSIYEDRAGNMWIGTWGDGVTKFKDGCVAHYRTKGGPGWNFVTTLYEDRDGYMWIATTRKLYRLNPRFLSGCNQHYLDGRSAYPDPNGFFGEGVWVIHQDRAGRFWFGTSNGLIKLEAGRYTRYTTSNGLAGNDVKAILEDRAGHLWFGSWGGLSSFDDGRFTSYTEQNGLASDHIRTLYEDAEGIFWIGTYDGGLSRFKDGRFTRYTTKEGLFNNGVFRILEDGRGYFWMSCNKGIYRVSRQDLNDFADGKIRSITSIAYGKNDGLLNVECNGGRQPAGWKTRDGKLWFPTAGGAAVIDPREINVNTMSPPVVIEELRIAGETVAFSDSVNVPPDKKSFDIEYKGLSFIKTEQVKYKYKLEGLDKDWVDAGARRVANYSYVPPGEYTFTVIAANSDGVWNQTGKSIRIKVIPYWWEIRWVQTLIGICILVGLVVTGFLIHRRRVSQLEKEKAMQEDFSKRLIDSQECERERVARELHDGLKQDFANIKMRAQLALTELDNPSLLHEQLNVIATEATQAIDETKEIAYNLRPYQLDRYGLTKSIEEMVKRISDSHKNKIVFQTRIDGIDGIFPKDSELNIYRIIQESVNNITDHSEATKAEVIIKKNFSGVELIVKDNGKGFITKSSESTEPVKRGFGLISIEERTRILGGKLTIQPIKGEGTTITVKLESEDG
jgi:signal transduction histidine kinase/ligand-binding sensor domain-containing protein